MTTTNLEEKYRWKYRNIGRNIEEKVGINTESKEIFYEKCLVTILVIYCLHKTSDIFYSTFS